MKIAQPEWMAGKVMSTDLKQAKLVFRKQCKTCGYFTNVTVVRTSAPDGWDRQIRYCCASCESELGEVCGFTVSVATDVPILE